MSIKLITNTTSKKLIINNIILYDENKGEFLTQFQANSMNYQESYIKTLIYNEIMEETKESKIEIDKIYILNLKKKNKLDYKEKQSYYITLNYDKYFNEYEVDLFLNKKYFDSIIINEESIKKQMDEGYFYVYDDIFIKFKKDIIFYSNQVKTLYFKNWNEASECGLYTRDLIDLKEEIKENTSIYEVNEKNFKKYKKYIENKIKEGFLYKGFKHEVFTVEANECNIKISKYKRSEKNEKRLKAEAISEKLKNQCGLYLEITPSQLLLLLKIFNINIDDINY